MESCWKAIYTYLKKYFEWSPRWYSVWHLCLLCNYHHILSGLLSDKCSDILTDSHISYILKLYRAYLLPIVLAFYLARSLRSGKEERWGGGSGGVLTPNLKSKNNHLTVWGGKTLESLSYQLATNLIKQTQFPKKLEVFKTKKTPYVSKKANIQIDLQFPLMKKETPADSHLVLAGHSRSPRGWSNSWKPPSAQRPAAPWRTGRSFGSLVGQGRLLTQRSCWKS